MLYQLRPDGSMHWISNLGPEVLELVDEYDADLDRLEWEEAERHVDRETLQLSFAHGRAGLHGVIVAARDLAPLDRLRRLLEVHAEAAPKRERYRKFLKENERLFPGAADMEAEADEEMAKGLNESITEAERELVQALEAEPDPGLEAHWKSLGGWTT